MTVIHASDADFAAKINTGKPVLVDFWATWCGPCRQVSPIIDAIAAEHPEYTVVKVDIDTAQATAQTFNVRSVPTLVVLNADGTLVSQSAGAKPKKTLLDALAKAS
jgi:thioredoxin 1